MTNLFIKCPKCGKETKVENMICTFHQRVDEVIPVYKVECASCGEFFCLTEEELNNDTYIN